MKTSNSLLPVLAALVANVFWGLSYLLTRVALGVTSPLILLAIRFFTASLLMTVLMLLRGKPIRFKGKHLLPMVFLMIAEPAGFFFESYGILYTNATLSGVVLAIVPIFAIGVAALFLKEYPTMRQLLYSIIPVAGVIIITISGNEIGVATPFGIFLLFCTCICYSCYRTVNRAASRDFEASERTYLVMLSSWIVFTFAALRSVDWNPAALVAPLKVPQFLLPMLTLSIFCSIVANNLANYAAEKLTVLKYSVVGTISTICSMFGGVLILGEPMTGKMLVGCFMVLFGIWQVTKPAKQTEA